MVAFSLFQYVVGMTSIACALHVQVIEGKTLNLRSRRELGAYRNKIWPKGIVCYDIPNGIAAVREQSLNAAIDLYREKLGIQFIKINECSEKFGSSSVVCGGCTAIVTVKDDKPGCYASLGYGKKQVLNCQFNKTGAFLHEMGHLLGRIHEHSHPDRKAIPLPGLIDTSTINQYAKNTGLQGVELEPYDYQSIMHYGRDYFCLPKDLSVNYCDVGESTGCVTATKDDCDSSKRVGVDGENPTFSEGDIATFKKMYSSELEGTGSDNTNVTSPLTTRPSSCGIKTPKVSLTNA
jgi:hypothetical protein